MSYETLFGLLFAGGIMGWIACEWHAEYQIKRLFRLYGEQLENDKSNTNIVLVEISKVGDTFLVHNQQTGEFLTQGKDHSEITKQLSKLNPNVVFSADPKNMIEVGYVKDE